VNARPIVRIASGPHGDVAACRLGVPLPRGWMPEGRAVAAFDPATKLPVPVQGRTLARWPDRSVKWLLLDAVVPEGGNAPAIELASDPVVPALLPDLPVERRPTGVSVDTGAITVAFDAAGDRLIGAVRDANGAEWLDASGVRVRAVGASGEPLSVITTGVCIDEAGPLRTVVSQTGEIAAGLARPLEFVARWSLTRGSAGLHLVLRVRNPNPALHPGGVWDLGDPGSARLADLSVELAPSGAASSLAWCSAPHDVPTRVEAADWHLYQDSSGGPCWDSPNHVEADGTPGVRFRGWHARGAGVDVRGDRAQPSVEVEVPAGCIAASVQDFWQNFPKALRWRAGRISAGFFPAERGRPVELQGGEQKRHRVAFAFGAGALAAVKGLVDPPHAWVDPAWVEASRVVPGAVVGLEATPAWRDHVSTIVEGPESFAERRERIDEYGWRHFGDLWADHEAVHHRGPEPFVSHYNNQYDFVHSAGLHALRTGDARWARLARESADHTVDIDVYHTDGDRSSFNGGLFWHTDHYLPARTATHRTYSRGNASGGDYGGGPSNEHDYASGLLLHHFRTGDPDALETVIGLAEWVVAMDDGARTLLGLVDAGPTGLASRTLDPDYHGPGRGAGNSIATLIDAYVGSGRRRFLDKAEELLRRCIHPRDDIAARGLDQPEQRWSYLMFLQVLGGHYLPLKQELGELDYGFHHARASLLHYADWMLEHEVPYQEIRERLELPTETWPAHDMRKCHVLHLAARYDDRGRRDAFAARAAFFHDRSLQDLGGFQTRHLTRPLVILAGCAHLHTYFQRLDAFPAAEIGRWRHNHDFGDPQPFRTQRDRVKDTLRARMVVMGRELRRVLRDRLGRWRARSPRAGGVPR
jgi:hypothetical protein